MPSDPYRLAWLRSQGLGVACGLSTVALLAVGSFAMAATRDGASAGIGMDDVRGFFSEPSPIHLWFYLLVPVLGLYAVNTALATWHGVSRKWLAGNRAPSTYAAALVHLAFLLALLAHGVGGLLGEERGQVLLAAGFRPLPGGGEARLLSLEVDSLPGGMPREVRARVEVKDGNGVLSENAVGYNAPLSAGLGSDLWLVAEQGRIPGAELEAEGNRCIASEGASCLLAGHEVELLQALPPGRFGPQPVAVLRVASAAAPRASSTGPSEDRWLVPGGEARLADGTVLRLTGLTAVPAVVLRGRHAPGNPWALGAALVLTLGLGLMWRRFLPPRRAPRPAPEEDDDELPPEPASGD